MTAQRLRITLRSEILAEVQFEHLGRILQPALTSGTGEIWKEALAYGPAQPLLQLSFLLSLFIFQSQPQPSRKPPLAPRTSLTSLLICTSRPGRRQLGGQRLYPCEGGGWLSVLPVTLCGHRQVAAASCTSFSSPETGNNNTCLA